MNLPQKDKKKHLALAVLNVNPFIKSNIKEISAEKVDLIYYAVSKIRKLKLMKESEFAHCLAIARTIYESETNLSKLALDNLINNVIDKEGKG